MKRWNLYRARALAHWWTKQGLTVIPNLTWAGKETYPWCFETLPKESTVFVSTVGVHADKAKEVFCDGMKAAMRVCKPSRVILYGGNVGFDFKNTEVIEFKANTAFGGK